MNIFEQFGIKEVSNVFFEALEDNTKVGENKGDIVLFLDTLKVSTIETSAEDVAARGGWGNPKLIVWDYGKEINITLEDALISMESLRMLMGGSLTQALKGQTGENKGTVKVHLTEEGVVKTADTEPELTHHLTGQKLTLPTKYRYINITTGQRGEVKSGETFKAAENDRVRFFWEENIEGGNAKGNEAIELTISPSTFPGTYKVVGETFMRSRDTGADEGFQFVINKAKITSNVTLTMQAEGDPSTFEMSLQVLESTNENGDKEMMKLIRYNMPKETGTASGGNDGE